MNRFTTFSPRKMMLLPLALLAAFALPGCEQGMQDMYDQPKYRPLASSSLFADGGASRLPVPGTVAHSTGTFAGTSSGRQGTRELLVWERDAHAPVNPYPITQQLLRRGRERFEIFCAPCHSPMGDGDGYVVRRGFPAPPSYHIPRLRSAPDRHLFDVISDGYGIMYPYRDRVAPPDRWAIVAYIRALQLSRNFPVAAADMQRFDRAVKRDGGS